LRNISGSLTKLRTVFTTKVNSKTAKCKVLDVKSH